MFLYSWFSLGPAQTVLCAVHVPEFDIMYVLYLQLICSYVFMPVAFMMGIPYDETFTVAELIGTKLFLNEFVAYEKLSELKMNRQNGLDAYVDGERMWISVSKSSKFDFCLCGCEIDFNNFTLCYIRCSCFFFQFIPGPIRDNLHVCSLWVCQLQLSGYLYRRPVWVFHLPSDMIVSYHRIRSLTYSVVSLQSLYLPSKKIRHLIYGAEGNAHWDLCVSCQCLHCR